MPHPAISDDELRLIADHAPIMCRRSGFEGQCDWVSAAMLEFGGGAFESYLGTGWETAVHPDDLAAFQSAYSRAFARQQSFSHDFRLRDADGSFHWIRETLRAVKDESGFVGYVGACVVIDELHEARARHRMAQEDRNHLLREVHHRVKNNLQTLMALLRYMRRTADASGQRLLDTLNLRLVAMSLVQRYLHGADDMNVVSIRDLVTSVLPALMESGLVGHPRLAEAAHDLHMPAQAAAYAGLAVSESVILLNESRAPDVEISITNDAKTGSVVIVRSPGGIGTRQLGTRLIGQYARGADATLEVTHEANALALIFRFGAV